MKQTYHWTIEDAKAVLKLMARVILELQWHIGKAYERAVPVEEWDEFDAGMLRDMGKWVLDGSPTSETGTGDGILPGLKLALRKCDDGTLTAMELYNFCVIFSRSDLLEASFAIGLIHNPITINGRDLEGVPDLGITWLGQHNVGFRKVASSAS